MTNQEEIDINFIEAFKIIMKLIENLNNRMTDLEISVQANKENFAERHDAKK